MAAAVPIEITVKSLSESGLKSIPSCFASKNLQDLEFIDPQEGTIPIIDFSLLTSSDPQHKSKIIQDLGRACEEWGFFLCPSDSAQRQVVPNALMMNIADQLEVVTNGKYKGAIHRATLYGKAMATRMSLAIAYGPCPDKVIRPASEFVNESHPPAYTALTCGEYYELHLANAYSKITALDYVRIQN
ncbi:hypothetical protein L6164_032615 [Bauhinia variegata]|uniref:Uncharacterized protein n=1 Tax=Bauhinia variegata TaxID=167791 RepID=A0ACB9KP79_BAUVA|nr:hypothetical protein L6164_032615 [Bauhinia variegata]